MPKLTRRQKYDYRDIDWRELKVIRVGHAVWTLFKRERRSPGSTHCETGPLLAACEAIWEVKRQLRAELKGQRALDFAKRSPFAYRA